MPGKRQARVSLRPRLRVLRNDEVALGPGKVELLKAVENAGSIAKAAAELGMSYMRAWTLIKTMNRCFKAPVVELLRGGKKHGGAELTEIGHGVLRLYEEMENKSIAATKPEWRRMKSLLR